MRTSSLPVDLRRLAQHARHCAKLSLGMSAAECGRVAVLLQLAAQEADLVVAQAADVPELEDELLAVAHDPNRAEPLVTSAYQAALKAQQQQIQRELDTEGPEPVTRPGLAALAMPIAGSNVTVFPVAPRPRPLGGGDAA
ncbi:MAG: hypothetical protein LCH80_05475 [Proteobacteria bacterium]|nr:hypothetical protein [Pseudomonadota bacterium]